MKKLFTLFVSLITATMAFAQGVAINNDGSAANASALLDVKSTTKGFMMPRMTSAQRIGITSPALGLLVFDTDTKTVWAYDGAIWKNLYAGGGLTLPYSQTINLTTPGLEVINQGSGPAIQASSSNDLGISLSARATGPFGWGIHALTNRPGATSIYAATDSGTVFRGENNYVNNTNTLMSLLNRGIAKTANFQLSNNSSTSANVQIAGNNLGEQLMIYQTNAANTKPAVSINNSGTGEGVNSTTTSGTGVLGTSTSGIGISGISSTNYGVKGVTNTATGFAGVYGQNTGTAGSGVVGTSHASNTQGVYGLSNSGIGVRANTDSYRGVQSTANTGTALYGSSTSGYALESNGKVKISGGNTNPGAGKVLTSDASGNATWQSAAPKIAFMSAGIIDPLTTNLIGSTPYPYEEYKKVEFKSEGYDIGNVYSLYSGNVTNSSSCFTVPVNGLYHFDAALNYLFATAFDYREIEIALMLRRNGVVSQIYLIGSYINDVDNTMLTLSTDYTLLAGDQIFIGTRQFNLVSLPSSLVDKYTQCFFSGHLVFTL